MYTAGKGWTGRMPWGLCGQSNLCPLSTSKRPSGEDKVMDATRHEGLKTLPAGSGMLTGGS